MAAWTGAAAVCISEAKRILMVLQGRPEEEKSWSVPTGGREPGESYEECCIREVLEETGYRVSIKGKLPYKNERIPYFAVEIVGGSVSIQDPDSLIEEVAWKSIGELSTLQLTYEEDRGFLMAVLSRASEDGSGVPIRRLQQEEAELYWRLRLKALREYPQAFGASYEEAKITPIESVKERFSSGDSSFILGAFSDTGSLIGMVGFRQENGRKMRHKGTVWGMYVEEAYQGRGIGKRLMRELLESASALPELEQIHLYVVDTNVPAKRLYRSLGFEPYGREVNAMKLEDGTYVHEDLMVLRLGSGED